MKLFKDLQKGDSIYLYTLDRDYRFCGWPMYLKKIQIAKVMYIEEYHSVIRLNYKTTTSNRTIYVDPDSCIDENCLSTSGITSDPNVFLTSRSLRSEPLSKNHYSWYWNTSYSQRIFLNRNTKYKQQSIKERIIDELKGLAYTTGKAGLADDIEMKYYENTNKYIGEMLKLLLTSDIITSFYVRNLKVELEKFNIYYNKSTSEGYTIVDKGNVSVFKDATAVVLRKATVNCFDTSKASLKDSSIAYCYDYSEIDAWDNSKVYSFDFSDIFCGGYSTAYVLRCHYCHVLDHAEVIAHKNCDVMAFNDAKVTSYGAKVMTRDPQVEIEAKTYTSYDNKVQYPSIISTQYKDKVKASKGTIIQELKW